MRTKQFNKEVIFAEDTIVKVNKSFIAHLKEMAKCNDRKRVRLCAHNNIDDNIHEMLIVHSKGNYIRPHKHLSKTESLHVIQGVADLILFGDDGTLYCVTQIGEHSSGADFFFRISEPCYHTLLIKSDFLVFHETTNGPFNIADTFFPEWAPDEGNKEIQDLYMDDLIKRVDMFYKKL